MYLVAGCAELRRRLPRGEAGPVGQEDAHRTMIVQSSAAPEQG
jgi:hypothetical protein